MPDYLELQGRPTTVTGFVDFWAKFYGYDDATYSQNIHEKGRVTTHNVVALMGWKAGRFSKEAENYAKAVPTRVLNGSRRRPPMSDRQLLTQYHQVLGHLQAAGLARSKPIIWPVFLCHIAQPRTTPIYDVNVWIAWGRIDGWILSKHYKQMPSSFTAYLEYRTWFNGLVGTYHLEPRELDRALVTFGRFLLSPWGAGTR